MKNFIYVTKHKTYIPKSIESAVDILMESLSKDQLNQIKQLEEDELWGVHMNLGQGIRNSMGLWGNNKALLRSCGSEDMHPDDASSAITTVRLK